MLKIRLMRIGAKKRPFYRVIVKEERSKRDGDYLELLGTYNPLTEPKDIKLKQDRIDHWVKQGAQMSVGFLRIIGKAPQRKPRKPKKTRIQDIGNRGQAKAEEQVQPTAEQPAEAPVAEAAPEEKPAEQPAQEPPVNEKELVVDDSAVQTESKEQGVSESVQNKKNEGSA